MVVGKGYFSYNTNIAFLWKRFSESYELYKNPPYHDPKSVTWMNFLFTTNTTLHWSIRHSASCALKLATGDWGLARTRSDQPVYPFIWMGVGHWSFNFWRNSARHHAAMSSLAGDQGGRRPRDENGKSWTERFQTNDIFLIGLAKPREGCVRSPPETDSTPAVVFKIWFLRYYVQDVPRTKHVVSVNEYTHLVRLFSVVKRPCGFIYWINK